MSRREIECSDRATTVGSTITGIIASGPRVRPVSDLGTVTYEGVLPSRDAPSAPCRADRRRRGRPCGRGRPGPADDRPAVLQPGTVRPGARGRTPRVDQSVDPVVGPARDGTRA